MHKFWIGVGAVVVAGAALVANAQPGPGRGMGRHGDGPKPAVLERQLGLSDEQSAKLQSLRQEERKQSIRRRAEMQVARMELDEALGAATIDEKAVNAKVETLTQLQAAALKARVDHRLAVARLLTPEQRAKMLRSERPRGDRNRGWGRQEKR